MRTTGVFSQYYPTAASSDGAMVFRGSVATGKMVAFYSHGILGTALDAKSPGMGRECRALAEMGFVAYAGNFTGGTHWSNDAALTAIDTALTWCGANLGTRTDKYVIAGESMGALHALNKFWRDSKAAACWARVPPVNLENAYAGSGLGGSMDAAYGGTMDLAERQSRDPNFATNRALLIAAKDNIYVQSQIGDEFFTIADARAWKTIVGCEYDEYPGTHADAYVNPPHGLGAAFCLRRCRAQGLL